MAKGKNNNPYASAKKIRQPQAPQMDAAARHNAANGGNWYGYGSRDVWQKAENARVAAGKREAAAKAKAKAKARASGRGCPTGRCGGGGGSSPKKSEYRYNKDWNSNLREATFKGNRENEKAIADFKKTADSLSGNFLDKSSELTQGTRDKYNTAYTGYNNEMRGYLDKLGTADQDIHTRTRGQAYAGLDSGFADANDQLQAQLARRGLSNAGIGAKAVGDLYQDRMRAGAEAGVGAYNSAIDRSDTRRGQRMQGAGTLYGANLNTIGQDYSLGMGDLTQNYQTKMDLQGQYLQNNINTNQQRIANLMGYSQLGRGMSGMSQNYLSQAGTNFGNIAKTAGSTALGMGQLSNSYNQTMQSALASHNATQANIYGSQMGAYTSAQNNKSEAKGGLLGTAGTLGAAAIGSFSDIRLKENVKKIGEVNGLNVYTWDWTDEAKEIVGDSKEYGFVAQEVREVYPEMVHADKDTGYLTVDYDGIIAMEV